MEDAVSNDEQMDHSIYQDTVGITSIKSSDDIIRKSSGTIKKGHPGVESSWDSKIYVWGDSTQISSGQLLVGKKKQELRLPHNLFELKLNKKTILTTVQPMP